MALFDPARHYPLSQLDWNRDMAQQAIRAIAQETIAQLQTVPLLSGHPMGDQALGSACILGKQASYGPSIICKASGPLTQPLMLRLISMPR